MFLPFPLRVLTVMFAIVFVGALMPMAYRSIPLEHLRMAQWIIMVCLLAGLVVSYRSFLGDLLRFLLEHTGQALILVILLLMLYGMVGASYGIPEMFWSEYGLARTLSAVAVTLLLSVIGINAYFFDPHPTLSRLKREGFLLHRSWKKFRRARKLVEKTRIGRAVAPWLFDDIPRDCFTNAHDVQQFLRLVRFPFLMLVSLPALFPMVFPYVPRVSPTGNFRLVDANTGHGGLAWLFAVISWGGGIFIGILLIRALLKFSTRFDASGRAVLPVPVDCEPDPVIRLIGTNVEVVSVAVNAVDYLPVADVATPTHVDSTDAGEGAERPIVPLIDAGSLGDVPASGIADAPPSSQAGAVFLGTTQENARPSADLAAPVLDDAFGSIVKETSQDTVDSDQFSYKKYADSQVGEAVNSTIDAGDAAAPETPRATRSLLRSNVHPTVVLAVATLAAILTCIDAAGLSDRLIDNPIWAWSHFIVVVVALGMVGGLVVDMTALRHPGLWTEFSRYLIQVAVTLVFFAIWDMTFHLLAGWSGSPILSRLEVSPGMAVCVLLALVSVIGAWFYMLGSETKRDQDGCLRWLTDPSNPRIKVRNALPLFLALTIWVGMVNNAPYKARFPNLSYAHPVDLVEKLKEVYPGVSPRAGATPAKPGIKLIDNDDAIKAWFRNACKEQGTTKPKLVVVCSSGGASRAAFWTAVVLDRLRNEPAIKGFDQSVRIITGASGGMVGASYYVSELNDGGKRATIRKEGDWVDDIETNPLPRITSHLALSGVPLMLLPRLPFLNVDRGVVLENQFVWKADRKPALSIPLSELRVKEGQGLIPSLIYTPVIVDDGRRLLISNLELESLAVNRGTEISEGDETQRVGWRKDSVSSLAGLEFFKFFNENGAEKLTLATAARMSASFPFLSPAVNLPSRPPIRLVDAGYYDNFGANLSAIWIGENWGRLHDLGVSGIVLVQIRAFVGRQERMAPPIDPEPAFDLARGYELIGSPVKAFTSGRFTGSVFRNDSELAALIEVVNNEADNPNFLTTVIFENSSIVQVVSTRKQDDPVWPGSQEGSGAEISDEFGPNTEVAMTWNLTENERLAMRRAVPSQALAEKTNYKNSKSSMAESPENRLRHINDLAESIKTEKSPSRRQQMTKDLERVLNYERVQALKQWWAAPLPPVKKAEPLQRP